jgi:hypothetical protein
MVIGSSSQFDLPILVQVAWNAQKHSVTIFSCCIANKTTGLRFPKIIRVHNNACVVGFVSFTFIFGALASEGKRGHFRRHR